MKALLSNGKFYFPLVILMITISYFICEWYLIAYTALASDEFVFLRHIYEYTFHLPYRDFPPYKTIIGYYLLSIPLFFSHTLFEPAFYIKHEIAIINSLMMVFASFWLSRFYDKRAVLLTLPALLANHFFLFYSTDIRVDMLTSWCCLFSVLAMIEHRVILSGMLMGVAFLVSQKALWYWFAIDGAMLLLAWYHASSMYDLRCFVKFNFNVLVPISVYVIYWSFISSPYVVFHNLFYEAYIQAGIDYYQSIYLLCWMVVLHHGPFLFLILPYSYVCLKEKVLLRDQDNVAIYSSIIALLLFIQYKQAFPYNFVFTFPAFFVFYTIFFDKYLSVTRQFSLSYFYYYAMAGCVIGLLMVVTIFKLSKVYYLILLFPIFSELFLHSKHKRPTVAKCSIVFALASYILSAICFPLYETNRASKQLDGAYQKTMLSVLATLLEKEDDYIAGIPYLYFKDQPIRGMKNLIGPSLDYLYEADKKLEPLFLPSLYLDVTTADNVIHDLKKSKVKILLNNYRMESLPLPIQHFMKREYYHYYGSLYVYAPIITNKEKQFFLKFSGNYQVLAKPDTVIFIDNQFFLPKAYITLREGHHYSFSSRSFRLKWIPKVGIPLNPAFYKDNYIKMLKAILT